MYLGYTRTGTPIPYEKFEYNVGSIDDIARVVQNVIVSGTSIKVDVMIHGRDNYKSFELSYVPSLRMAELKRLRDYINTHSARGVMMEYRRAR
jgi:hypothetical protein